MRKFLTILFLGNVVIFCCTSGKAQRANIVKSEHSTRLPYAIVFNEVDPEEKDSRQVIVLVKEESFTEDNLIRILKLIEARFPRPAALFLEFFTNLDDIETPEERDAPRMTNHKAGASKKDKGHSAIFIRLSKGKYGNCFMYFADGRFQEVKIK